MKLKIKKGDTVKVISGNDKGKTGTVLSINTELNKAIVEGVSLATKHVKPSAKSPSGGIIKKEALIQVSNLSLIDSEGNISKVGRKLDENNKLQRYFKTTGQIIK